MWALRPRVLTDRMYSTGVGLPVWDGGASGGGGGGAKVLLRVLLDAPVGLAELRKHALLLWHNNVSQFKTQHAADNTRHSASGHGRSQLHRTQAPDRSKVNICLASPRRTKPLDERTRVMRQRAALPSGTQGVVKGQRRASCCRCCCSYAACRQRQSAHTELRSVQHWAECVGAYVLH